MAHLFLTENDDDGEVNAVYCFSLITTFIDGLDDGYTVHFARVDCSNVTAAIVNDDLMCPDLLRQFVEC